MTHTDGKPVIRLRLGFFEGFETVVGLLRDIGARREEPRLFVLDDGLTIHQAVALVKLLEYSRKDANRPVKVMVEPGIDHRGYLEDSAALYAWWGTKDNWR
ncbi:hypothetical protein [Streptomyces sp. NPDC037389]|uniref:hypothetical protein n=1 Tax=Streptomyces sp. NPDC037389 TaxID=3155369 RepID=UPI0033E8ADA5